MRRIQKGSEPLSLTAHRERRHLSGIPPESLTSDDEPNWDNYTQKEDARFCTRWEQRQICAFCQANIAQKERGIKLAHVVAQKDPADGKRLELTWNNIVGACLGGEDTGRPRLLHCDSLQGQSRLRPQLDPVQFENGSLSYEDDGRICSSDPAVDRELNALLGLNIAPLKDRRLAALTALEEDLADSADREARRQELLHRLAPDQRSEERLPEYADFLRWHLRDGKLAAAK
jgi:hypothetical protein